ncbi:MAG: hypothetical protein ACKPB7_30890, partial [Sphaerospermopsis kisseleviana]
AKKGDSPWPLYNLLDIEKWGGGCWINETEGEKNADYLASIGFVGCSVTGTASEADIKYGYQMAINAGIVGIIYHQDNDKAGATKGKKHKKIADNLGIPFIVIPAKELDPEIKEAGDIADIIETGKITNEGLRQFLDNKIKEFVEDGNQKEPLLNIVKIARKKPITTFNQIGFDSLYEDQNYICVSDNFYQWQGNYYKLIEDKCELKRIQDFCNNYSVRSENKEGEEKITYPFASTKWVNELY